MADLLNDPITPPAALAGENPLLNPIPEAAPPRPQLINSQDLVDNAKAQLRTTALGAIQQNADQYAQAQQVEATTGIPAPVAARNLPETKLRADVDKYEQFYDQHPELQERLSDYHYARIAHDDLEAQGNMAKVVRGLRAVPANINAAVATGGLGTLNAITDQLAGVEKYLTENTWLSGNMFQQVNEAVRSEVLQSEQDTAALQGPLEHAGTTERYVLSGIQSAAQNALPIIAGVLTGNPEIALTTMAGTVFGQAYGQANDENPDLSPANKLIYAANQAAAEYLTEKIPVHLLLGDLAKGASLSKILMHQLASEVPGEEASTLMQNFSTWTSLHPDQPLSAFTADIPDQAAQTLVATLVQSLLMTGGAHLTNRIAARYADRVGRASHAVETQEGLAGLNEVSNASKVRERNPAAFASAVQDVADANDVPDMHIDGKLFAEALNQGKIDPASLPQSISGQLPAAQAMGGDVVVPVGDYAAHIAPLSVAEGLMPHWRMGADALSLKESEDFQANHEGVFQEEVVKAMAEPPGPTGGAAVEEAINSRLGEIGRFRPEVNDAYAKLTRAFYETMAQRTGIPVAQLFAAQPLNIQAESPAGQTRAPTTPDLTRRLDAFEAEHNAMGAARDGNQTLPASDTLEGALRELTTPSWSFEGAQKAATIAQAEGRGDVVEAFAERAQRHADRQTKTAEALPPEDPARERMLERAQVAQQQADELAGLRDPAAAQYQQAADGGAPTLEPRALANVSNHLTTAEKAQLRADTSRKLVDLFKSLPKTQDFVDAAQAGEAKRGWYRDSAQAIQTIFESDSPRFAALLAATSPQTSVENNLLNALSIWRNWLAAGRPTDREHILDIMGKSVQGGRGRDSILPAWINNSLRALASEDPSKLTISGPKVDSFMRNLLGETQAVTNDAWMANFAFIDQTLFAGSLNKTGPGKGPGYLAMSAKVRAAAKKLGWTPAEVQETIWSWAKTAYELADAKGEHRTVEELVKANAVTDERIAATPDFGTLFTNDAAIRTILESAGYGRALAALSGNVAQRDTGAAKPGNANTPRGVTPGLLRSARRLDALRAERAQSAGGERGGSYRQEASGREGESSLPGALAGLPSTSPGPILAIQQAALEYQKSIGLPPRLQSAFVKADPERGARIAEAFDQMQHAPQNQKVQSAYRALINETLAQYQVVKELGIKVEIIPEGAAEPYPEGPRQVLEDLKNKHLWTYPTASGFGTINQVLDNPLLAPTEEKIGDHVLLANDIFRIVHDVFGHGKEGVGFGPSGEENAWQAHVRMFTPLAAQAMTSETRGQNSWVNFGPHGEANRANQKATVYADQKVGLLPDWVMREGLAPELGDVYEQPARGAFDPTSNTIALFRTADLSTFLHESGHFYLESYLKLAGTAGVGDALKEDTATLFKWLGVKDAADWEARGIEEKREAHEKFARGFEAYLFDGRAPSIGLSRIFARFASWLVNVYRSVKSLGVQISPEIRGVFDRMLATQEEIAHAETVRHYTPLFATAEAAGLTPEEFARYQELGQQATANAESELQTKSLKNMALFSGAKSRELKKLQAQMADRRKVVEKEATATVAAEPTYAAQRFLRKGEVTFNGEEIKAEAGFKLSLDALAEMYPKGALGAFDYSRLQEMRLTTGNNGLHPDLVAQIFGFSSGDELVRTLIDAHPIAESIEGLTDRLMLERFGDMTDPQGLEREAEKAIHNQMRAKFVAMELRALTRALTVRAPTGESDVRGRPLSFNVLTDAAKNFARILIERKKVRDVKPAQFTAGETRAARNAEEQLKKGKLAEAAAEKRNQLVNLYAAREAADALEMIEKGVAHLRKFESNSVRKAIDVEYLDQIDKLLERFELRPATNRLIDKRASLADWIKSQDAENLPAEITPAMVNEAMRTHYKNLSVLEFRGLVDSIKNIEHLGRLKRRLIVAAAGREFLEARDDLVATIRENATKVLPDKRISERGPLTQIGKLFKGFFAAHRKFASIIREMDGWKDAGPAWQILVRSMNDRANFETTEDEKATIGLINLLKPILGRDMTRQVYDKNVGASLSREERIGIALNVGNATNLERIMTGEGEKNPDSRLKLNPQKLRYILDSLSQEEWKFVQGTWDFIDQYWPQIEEKQTRLTGIRPEKVQATPVQTKYGEMRGGYYPIAYDPDRSDRSRADIEGMVAKQVAQGHYTRAQTARGHVEARTESTGRPLRYDFGNVIAGHVRQVLHDLAWHEYLIDANRLINDKQVAAALKDHIGQFKVKVLRDTLRDIAVGNLPAQNDGEALITKMRHNAVVAGLGWRLTTALMQPIGLTQSMQRIGTVHVLKGIGHWFGDAARFQSSAKKIYEKSDFMRLRAKTLTREINEIRNKVTGEDSHLVASYFYMINKLQQVVDVPTWWGAYEKAMSAPETADEAMAIALADQSVIDAQSSGHIKDLAPIQRGSESWKLFTAFYSFFDTTYNQTVEAVGRTNFAKPKDLARFTADMALLYSIPAALGTLLKFAIKAAVSGDWDQDKFNKQLIGDQLGYLLSTMVLLREMQPATNALLGLPGGDYTGPAGTRAFGTFAAAGKQLYKVANGGEADEKFWKALVEAAAYNPFFAFPAGQLMQTVDGAAALADGRTENPLALVSGPPPAR